MKECAEAQPETLTGFHDNPADIALLHRLPPERIRHHDAIIAVMEPAGWKFAGRA